GISVVNWPLHRIFLSTFANRYIRAITRLAATDCTSGFRCWRRETLAALPLDRILSDNYAFLVELVWEAASRGARVAEVPITFVERTRGESKMSNAIVVEALWRVTLWGLARIFGRR
ncbi:MAG: dolichol-phosphate mannosyltransferase, partial [Aeromicrobium sp.]